MTKAPAIKTGTRLTCLLYTSAALLVMIVIFAAIDSSYVTVGNFVDIVKQATINGIIAIGITFAIITGGIDLSVGSTFAIVNIGVQGVQTR